MIVSVCNPVYPLCKNSVHNISDTNLDCRDVSHKIFKKYCSDIYEDVIYLNVKYMTISCINTKHI